MGEGNKKLSKRDPQSAIGFYREAGFIPEGLLNYLALLGWSISEDRDIFGLDEMVAAFEISRVNANPARFDLKKAEAINATHIRTLGADDFADAHPGPPGARRRPARRRRRPSRSRSSTAAAPLVQERMILLAEAVAMLGFLFVDEAAFVRRRGRAAKVLEQGSAQAAGRRARRAR